MPPTNPATEPPSTKRFYLPKGRVTPVLAGIMKLQARTDLSGKFARKVGRIRRKLSAIEETVVGEITDLQEQHKQRGTDGAPLPVFKQNALGQVVFKKDGSGKDTDEPEILHSQFHPVDQEKYNRELNEANEERIAVDCESFSDQELDAFKAIEGTIIDAMQDLSDSESEYLTPPAAVTSDESTEAESIEEPVVSADPTEDRSAP